MKTIYRVSICSDDKILTTVEEFETKKRAMVYVFNNRHDLCSNTYFSIEIFDRSCTLNFTSKELNAEYVKRLGNLEVYLKTFSLNFQKYIRKTVGLNDLSIFWNTKEDLDIEFKSWFELGVKHEFEMKNKKKEEYIEF